MNIQDHLTQDRSTLKRKYDEEHDTQDQSTQDQSPIKRKYDEEHDTQDQTPIKIKCEYFIIHDKVCTCCKRMTNKISEYTSTVTRES